MMLILFFFFFSSRRRHTRWTGDWSSDVCSSDLLGRLALRVVEIRRNGDDGLLDLLPEMRLGGLLHLLQDERRDLRGRILLAVGLDPGVAVRGADDLVGNELLVLLHHRIVIAPADQSLDGEEGALRIGDR